MSSNTTQPQIGGQTSGIRAPLPLEKLIPFLESSIPSFDGGIHGSGARQSRGRGQVTVQQFKFGQSNPTYLITDASDQALKFVLRRKPSGKLISPTAHRIEREFLVLHRISAYNDLISSSEVPGGEDRRIPVPRVYCLCEDESVVGAGFYVMEYLQGRIFEDVEMPEIESEEERRAW